MVSTSPEGSPGDTNSVAGLVVLDRWSRQYKNLYWWEGHELSLALLYWIDGLDIVQMHKAYEIQERYVAGLVVLDRWSRHFERSRRKFLRNVAGLVVLDRWSRLRVQPAIQVVFKSVAGLVVLDRWSRL